MIPKIIHYCWLSGDPYPEIVEKCIASWQKKMPDYELVLWDMDNFNIKENDWVREAFETKKYAFAADYIRFYALYHYGGIYLDTDVEAVQIFDNILNCQSFIGFEYSGDFEAAVIGAKKNTLWVKDCLDYYEKKHFIKHNGQFDMKPLPRIIEEIIIKNIDQSRINKNRLSLDKSIHIYPYQYFSPKNIYTKQTHVTDDTVTIHHFNESWVEKNTINFLKKLIHKFLIMFFGKKHHDFMVKNLRKL